MILLSDSLSIRRSRHSSRTRTVVGWGMLQKMEICPKVLPGSRRETVSSDPSCPMPTSSCWTIAAKNPSNHETFIWKLILTLGKKTDYFRQALAQWCISMSAPHSKKMKLYLSVIFNKKSLCWMFSGSTFQLYI